MTWLAELTGVDPQTATLLVLLCVLGALLGGAIGHWRGGSGRIVSGAIIGAILLPVAGLAFLLHLGMMAVVAVIAAVAAMFAGILG
jgi:hypothetical protein